MSFSLGDSIRGDDAYLLIIGAALIAFLLCCCCVTCGYYFFCVKNKLHEADENEHETKGSDHRVVKVTPVDAGEGDYLFKRQAKTVTTINVRSPKKNAAHIPDNKSNETSIDSQLVACDDEGILDVKPLRTSNSNDIDGEYAMKATEHKMKKPLTPSSHDMVKPVTPSSHNNRYNIGDAESSFDV